MVQSDSGRLMQWPIRLAACLATAIGGFWIWAWLTGRAGHWSADGVITVKTNMAVGQCLAGIALLLLSEVKLRPAIRTMALGLSCCVLLIGGLTFCEHLLGVNFGIDEILAQEAPGAVATTLPNRMGIPGSLSLSLLGMGLLALTWRKRFAAALGIAVCLINLIPLLGFLYRIQEFYSRPQLTGIAWPSVLALMSVSAGLILRDQESGIIPKLRQKDAGGLLLRQWLPTVLLVPIVLGFITTLGVHRGWYDTEFGSGMLVLVLVLIFTMLLWRSADYLSRASRSQLAAEDLLRASEQRYRLLFDRNPDGVFVVDPTGRFTIANPACETISGYSREELLQKTLLELCAPDQLAGTAEQFQRSLRDQKYAQLETAMIRKDGRKVELWITGEPMVQQGRVVAVHCTARDITEKNRVESELRESEAQFRTLADSIPHLAWWADAAGDITWYNRRWHEYTGTTTKQVSGWGWETVHDPKMLPAVLERWKHSLATGEFFEMEFPLRGGDGQFRWFLTRAIPIRDKTGKVLRWFGTNTDISERRQAREVLARSKQELEQLVAERTAKLQDLVAELEHFSYTITHDMRAPLRAMKGFSEVIDELVSDSGESQIRVFVRRIKTAADRMDSLIRDALNYSRAVRQELPLEPVDTAALLRGMLDSYPEFQPSKANILVEGTLPLVLGNEAGLTQCLSNLLGNAVKFVPPGTTPDIRVWAEKREQWTRIYVQDNGIGIPEIMLPRIFEMFSRGQNTYEGTGIGLALVRKVVQRMDGRVGVESQEGKGSRFWLELKSWERTEG